MTNDIGVQIRKFFSDLFGSKLAQRAEIELVQVRQDFETRLREKDLYAVDLKDEITRLRSKLAEYELVLIPLTSGGLFGPKKTPSTLEPIVEPSSWRAMQDAFYKEQEEAEKPKEAV